MIAYKGFRPGLICRGYQFVMGLNTTEKANCRENGFHCAEDPLDCLSYYSSLEHSEYYIVNAGGDIDEDEHDSKIACTELTVIKRLTKEELFLHGLAYMVDHPRRVWSSHVAANRAMANCGYAVVRGKDPVATGRLGDILAFAKEAPDSESIVQVAVGRIDGVTLCVHVGAGPERNTLHAAWDDDDAIQRIVHELNFGRYAAGRNGLHTAQQDCPVGRGKEKSA